MDVTFAAHGWHVTIFPFGLALLGGIAVLIIAAVVILKRFASAS